MATITIQEEPEITYVNVKDRIVKMVVIPTAIQSNNMEKIVDKKNPDSDTEVNIKIVLI